MRQHLITVTCVGLLILPVQPTTSAQENSAEAVPAQKEKAGSEAQEQPIDAMHEPRPAPKPAPYRTKGWGARLETDPPGYVKPLSEHAKRYGIEAREDLDWLDFGLEHRTRFELRDDDYRRAELESDEQFLLRTRTYLGIREVLDPFRFAFEFQDARQFSSEFPETNSDVDEADVLQLFGELYFKDAFGPDQPLRIRLGRQSFDLVDRKIIGRNRWRNATNAFDGLRVTIGQPASDWQVDVLATRPVERRLTRPDVPDDERAFYGIAGAWRKWSQIFTLEPYYFVHDEDRKGPTAADREIHTLGMHAFGPIGKTRFDYDADVAFQCGRDGPRNHRAFAAYGELGYTFEHEGKPRLSFSGLYGSGDRDPDDNKSERFDRLFANNHPRSQMDLFTWQNVINPTIRLEFQPLDRLRVDTSFGAYWLASDSDAWVVPGRRDAEGRSGDFVGQEFNLRMRYALTKNAELETGYAHFFPGSFVKNTGPADDSDFFYFTVTLTF
jgi:hypothetical protein